MCSVEGDAVPLQVNRPSKDGCAKCKRDVPIVVTRVNDAFCQDCFRAYAVHKFRSTIGKSKVIVAREHVLVAYSGGPASSALLHLIHQGLKEEKLRFTVTVVHIDEVGVVPGVSQSERAEKVGQVVRLVSQAGFPLLLSTLERAMSSGGDGGGPLCEEVTPSTDVSALLACGEGERLKAALTALPTPSAREDFLTVTRTRLLVELCRQRGFHKVVVGDTASLLASRIMAHMAKGRGGQVAFDSSIGDDRYGDVTVVRPLRELNLKEVEAYNRLEGVEWVLLPDMRHQWHSGNSIDQLTASFIAGLQESYPSTVPNIVRTSGKLGQSDRCQTQQDKCAMCQSPLDTAVGEASALHAVEVSERLMRGEGTFPSQVTDPAASTPDRCPTSDVRQGLCYACRLMTRGLKDLSLLPPFVHKQIKTPLTREEMRSQISEFLIEEND